MNYPEVWAPSTLASPDESALEGSYFLAPVAPQGLNTPATRMYQAAVAKYGNNVGDGLHRKFGYIEADLMIQGLQRAKGTATAGTVTAAIEGISHYSAGGLLPQSFNYAPAARSSAANVQKCNWPMEILHKKFVVLKKTPICGTVVKTK